MNTFIINLHYINAKCCLCIHTMADTKNCQNTFAIWNIMVFKVQVMNNLPPFPVNWLPSCFLRSTHTFFALSNQLNSKNTQFWALSFNKNHSSSNKVWALAQTHCSPKQSNTNITHLLNTVNVSQRKSGMQSLWILTVYSFPLSCTQWLLWHWNLLMVNHLPCHTGVLWICLRTLGS